jgi:hypothetical protein
MSGHLYILTDGVNTKIGITTDLSKRLSSYKTHNPNFQQFKVYACEIDEAKRVEGVIKQAFKDKLSSSSKEWFSVNPEVIDRYVSVLLITPTQDNITPAMHGVRFTSEAGEIKNKILQALKAKGGFADDANQHKDILAECFANRFGLGIPYHKLPDDLVIKDGLGVDINNCDTESKLAQEGVSSNHVHISYDDHTDNFYHLVKLASGHFIAVCTAKVSMPYLKAIKGKDEEIIDAASAVGWYATFHHDWSWYYPDESGLILFQKKTPVPIILKQWDSSFRKWVVERSVLLKQEKTSNRDNLIKCIEDISYDNTFPLDIQSYDELCDKYLEPYWGYNKDDDFFLKESYSLLIEKWRH